MPERINITILCDVTWCRLVDGNKVSGESKNYFFWVKGGNGFFRNTENPLEDYTVSQDGREPH
jgi:hypothetical protein